MRVGVNFGQLDFLPRDETGDFEVDEPTEFSYVSVPVYFSANFYAMHRFAVRPLLGMGIGFDVARLSYGFNPPWRLTQQNVGKVDVSARLGFEIHAGLDIRVTNYIGIQAEIRQNWGVRHTPNTDGVPAFSATGTTLVTSVRVGFPGRRKLSASSGKVRTRASPRPNKPVAVGGLQSQTTGAQSPGKTR